MGTGEERYGIGVWYDVGVRHGNEDPSQVEVGSGRERCSRLGAETGGDLGQGEVEGVQGTRNRLGRGIIGRGRCRCHSCSTQHTLAKTHVG